MDDFLLTCFCLPLPITMALEVDSVVSSSLLVSSLLVVEGLSLADLMARGG